MKPSLTYQFLRLSSRLCVLAPLRFKVAGREHIPMSGPVILACNHQSYLDPLLLGSGSPRKPIQYMARESLYRNPIFAWLLYQLHTFPVKRGGADRGAWKVFENYVKAGEQVSFFPEGTRSVDGRLQTANPGSGMLIHRCPGATVLPVRIRGTYKVWNKDFGLGGLHPVSIAFGPPLDLKEEFASEGCREVYQRIADKIMVGIAAIPPVDGRDDDLPLGALPPANKDFDGEKSA